MPLLFFLKEIIYYYIFNCYVIIIYRIGKGDEL